MAHHSATDRPVQNLEEEWAIGDAMTRDRLMWYGHIEQNNDMDWIKDCNVSGGRDSSHWQA